MLSPYASEAFLVRLAASDHLRVPAIASPLSGIRTSWCHLETGVTPGAAAHSVGLELAELGWIAELAVRGPREGPPLQFADVGDLQGDPQVPCWDYPW
jgi:hypothetical protein